MVANKRSHIIGPAILSEPRHKGRGDVSVIESRLLKIMAPGRYYSVRDACKRTDMDLSTIDESLKRLNKKGLISIYWYLDVDGFKQMKYKVFALKNVSDNHQILKTPSSSSSSSSESDSESDNIYPYSKVHIRMSSEENSEAVEVV